MIPRDSLILELINEDGANDGPVALLIEACFNTTSRANNWRNVGNAKFLFELFNF